MYAKLINIVLLLFAFCTQAQSTESSVNADSISLQVDTNVTLNQTHQNIIKKTVLHSALVPGWGQIDNNEKWKAPLFVGGIATSLGLGIYAQTQYKKNGSLKGFRNGMFISAATIYSINLFDAYAVSKARLQNKKHSPVKAAYFSTLLPGLGQVYNKKAWKLPIVYGAMGVTAYFLAFNARRFKGFTDAYVNFGVAGYEPEPYTLNYSDTGLLNARQYYLRNVELLSIVMGALYIANVIDAVVDAHLFDFNVDEDLGLKIAPQINYKSYGLALNLNF